MRGEGKATNLVLALAAALIALAAASSLQPASASAAPPELWTACPSGSAAGQCLLPRGVAANPDGGRIYVSDQQNFRIVEFTALGEFVKAWGWDVVASGPGDDTTVPEDQFEVCIPEDGDICQKGTVGSGPGQFGGFGPQGVASDSAGNVYVVDVSNRRVQKFSPDGQFLLAFEGEPQFEWVVGSFIAIDDRGTPTAADDRVYLGDENRIQRFDTGGAHQGEMAVSGAVLSLAADPGGDLYVSFSGQSDVRRLSPSGTDVCTMKVARPSAIAVDDFGHVYVASAPFASGSEIIPLEVVRFGSASCLEEERFVPEGASGSTGLAANVCAGSEAPGSLYLTNANAAEAFLRAYGTDPVGCFQVRTGEASNLAETSARLNGTVDPDGGAVSECRFEYGTTTGYGATVPCAQSPAEIGTGFDPVDVHADIGGLQKGTVYHFRIRATVGGEPESGVDRTFKTLGPPTIADAHTAAATETEATLAARVDPEGLATTYRVDYGPTAAYGQSTPVTAIGSERGFQDITITLEGLEPGATYHWQLVAQNVSGPATSGDRTVTTYRVATPLDPCANDAFRVDAGALLPDCRGYEMVSPVDKNGGDIVSGLNNNADPGAYVQVSPDGDRVSYAALTSFGDQPNSFLVNQYLAERGDGGWSSHGIHPSVTGRPADEVFFGFPRAFMAFTPDLCATWLIDYQTPPPTADGQVDYRNLYRRENCGPEAGVLQPLVPSPPPLPAGTPPEYVNNLSVQGHSDDGRHAFFLAKAKLTPEAAGPTNFQIYDRFEGKSALVSIRPNGAADITPTALGSGWSFNLDNAVSDDGSVVYWTSNIDNAGMGRIFVRERPEQGKVSGECIEPAKACTRAVSGLTPGFFWSAASDGSKVLFSEFNLGTLETDLVVWDLSKARASEPARQVIATNVEGVAGASDDLSRVYHVSRDVLSGTQPNSEGDVAQEGEPNLYLAAGGANTFVATLSETDLGVLEPDADIVAYSVADSSTYLRSARVTPDGAHIVFQSRAQLSGFDNTDTLTGKPAVEVFRYAAGGTLECVSCNPSGAWPTTRELAQPYTTISKLLTTEVRAAAWIPTWEHPNHDSNVISADGQRLFFNSNDPLLPRDKNDAQDVYEWEAAGTGSCDSGDGSFFPQNGGCLYLISSAQSSFESKFWEASLDGEDVFFTTDSSLVAGDPGLVDLYDARVGGGFPVPPEPKDCEGEACQPPAVPGPPPPVPPASSTFVGPGNPPKGKRCPRGKRRVVRKGKVRCVKKRNRGHKRRAKANRNRRASR